MKKDLTKIADLDSQSTHEIIDRAFSFKRMYDRGVRKQDILDGRSVALVFEKPSLRTKVSFEVATRHLGGIPVYLSSSQILASGHNERGRESIPDIGRNLERLCDLIVARVYQHRVIEELAESISIPIINALCDKHHPTQALADMMAIMWHKSDMKKVKVSYVGDGNNVATSLMQVCSLMGFDFSIATPDDYRIPKEEIDIAKKFAKDSGSIVECITDPNIAVKEADVVYTDTFVSMGQEEEGMKRLKDFENYQVNSKLMKKAKKDALFMHCLPAHRGEEVTDEVMDSPSSIVFDQAECRLHVAKALLSLMLK